MTMQTSLKHIGSCSSLSYNFKYYIKRMCKHKGIVTLMLNLFPDKPLLYKSCHAALNETSKYKQSHSGQRLKIHVQYFSLFKKP